LLFDPYYAKRAAEVSHLVQAEDGVCAACDAIEAYLCSHGRSTHAEI
jgi:hypothetical protein